MFSIIILQIHLISIVAVSQINCIIVFSICKNGKLKRTGANTTNPFARDRVIKFNTGGVQH